MQLLLVNLVMEATKHAITWKDWALVEMVLEVVLLLMIKILLYMVYPLEVKDSMDAHKELQQRHHYGKSFDKAQQL
jgi:di/tricarboxylate transporter